MVRDINWIIKDFERLFDQSVRLEAEDDFSQGFNAGWAEARKAMYALTRQVDCQCGEVPAETDIDVPSGFQELDRLAHSMEKWDWAVSHKKRSAYMKIKIAIYKNSGKWYTHDTVKSEKRIPMFKEEYRQFLINNLPSGLDDGWYVVVSNADENDDGFYEALYTKEQLMTPWI